MYVNTEFLETTISNLYIHKDLLVLNVLLDTNVILNIMPFVLILVKIMILKLEETLEILVMTEILEILVTKIITMITTTETKVEIMIIVVEMMIMTDN